MSAHSNVSFDLLTEAEQIERYKNLRSEYLSLLKRFGLKEEEKLKGAQRKGRAATFSQTRSIE